MLGVSALVGRRSTTVSRESDLRYPAPVHGVRCQLARGAISWSELPPHETHGDRGAMVYGCKVPGRQRWSEHRTAL